MKQKYEIHIAEINETLMKLLNLLPRTQIHAVTMRTDLAQ